MTVTRTLPCKVIGIATRLRMENDDEIYLKLLCMRVDRAVVFLENSSRKLFLITSVPLRAALLVRECSTSVSSGGAIPIPSAWVVLTSADCDDKTQESLKLL